MLGLRVRPLSNPNIKLLFLIISLISDFAGLLYIVEYRIISEHALSLHLLINISNKPDQ